MGRSHNQFALDDKLTARRSQPRAVGLVGKLASRRKLGENAGLREVGGGHLGVGEWARTLLGVGPPPPRSKRMPECQKMSS